MNANEYWRAIVERNPAFADESKRVVLPVAKLRALLEAAHAEGAREAADLREMLMNHRRIEAAAALKELFRMAGKDHE